MTVNERPTKTLFVINFNPIHLRVEDIKRHFWVSWRGSWCQNSIEFCICAVWDTRRCYKSSSLHAHDVSQHVLTIFLVKMARLDFSLLDRMINILDRVVSVEYALRDDSERGGRYDCPWRGSYFGRSPSPDYDKYNGLVHDRNQSPDYGRNRSPEYGRHCRYCFPHELSFSTFIF